MTDDSLDYDYLDMLAVEITQNILTSFYMYYPNKMNDNDVLSNLLEDNISDAIEKFLEINELKITSIM